MLLSFFSLFSCKAYKDLPVDAFQKILSSDAAAQLVDVRTPEEYAAGHLDGAVNIDWKIDDTGHGFMELAKTQLRTDLPVLVYCRSGRRSAAAAGMLTKAGFKVYNMAGGYLAWTGAGMPFSTYESERFFTSGGVPVVITLIKHGSLAISYKGLSIQVDPVSKLGDRVTDYSADFPKADVILVTHEHFDHFDKAAIETLQKEGTVLVTNQRCAQMLGWGTALSNGDSFTLPEDILLDAVPAYNTTEGHTQFHPKGRDNGFVLSMDGLRIYIAGDTEDIPEMVEIKDVDVAFLPVNQPYTMTPEQCIAAAKTIAPKVLIPYHYSQTDLSGIPAALPGIDVRIRQMQ